MTKAITMLYGLPRKVSHIARGAIVDPSPGNNSHARCWITRHTSVYKHPANDGSATDQFAILVTQELQDLWAAKKGALFTRTQRTWILSHLNNVKDISAWKYTDPQTGEKYLLKTDVNLSNLIK